MSQDALGLVETKGLIGAVHHIVVLDVLYWICGFHCGSYTRLPMTSATGRICRISSANFSGLARTWLLQVA